MLKAGFARVDVTPQLGVYMSGKFNDRYAKGILDPLQLNALALFDGNETQLIIIADFIGVDCKFCDRIRRKIARRTSLDETHIMLSALHQHTAICIGAREENRDESVLNDPVYMENLYRKYCDVAQMALDDMSEAHLGFGMEETAEPIAFIRRYLLKDGTVMGHPVGRTHEIVRRIGEGDNRVRLLRFVREGKNDVAFVNFCTHPDVISGELFSADWPGFVRRYVEKDLEGVSCLLLNGVQGDSNHCDYLADEVKWGYAHSAYMGRTIADVVVKLWEHTASVTDTRLGCARQDLYLRTRTDEVERYDECKEILDATNERRIPRPTGAVLGNAGRVVRLRTSPVFQKVPLSAMRIGTICIVGYGGEPFTGYAAAIERAHPELTLLTSCCCNGYEGYLPTKEILCESGYEASSSPFEADLEEKCHNAAMELIDQLWQD